jgi:hypothetical protein
MPKRKLRADAPQSPVEALSDFWRAQIKLDIDTNLQRSRAHRLGDVFKAAALAKLGYSDPWVTSLVTDMRLEPDGTDQHTWLRMTIWAYQDGEKTERTEEVWLTAEESKEALDVAQASHERLYAERR